MKKNGGISNEQVETLVAFAKGLDLSEVSWEDGEQKVAFTLRKAPPPPAPKAAAAAPAAPAQPKLHYITAPFVGTFLRAPKDRPPLVVEGEEIESGDKVGFVEAMKVARDVVSHVNGRIVKILIENGKSVEYGQKIFEVEPR
jgi:acetyl-CoA carboxylase biotin carboxyl carrier protein